MYQIIKVATLLLIAVFTSLSTQAQVDTSIIRKIYQASYADNIAELQLRHLCKKTPNRLVCSPASRNASEYMLKQMIQHGADNSWMQPLKAPCWKSLKNAELYYDNELGIRTDLAICDLGGSISTQKKGLKAQVIEVQNFDHLHTFGHEKIEGKIVFFNIPMDSGYAKTVKYRFWGAAKAAEYGASAVVVRSLTNRMDDYPHTGGMRYDDTHPKIPATMISTNDANALHRLLHSNPERMFTLKVKTEFCDSCITNNTIAEITGTEKPDEVIVVGGHIDSWHNTEGAHDDATGCIMASEVLRIFKNIGYNPKHTVRAIMFMDEEYAQSGAKKYASWVKETGEKHIAAIESDAGAFAPEAFGIKANSEVIDFMQQFSSYFEPYHTMQFKAGYGGVDIGPLKQFEIPLLGYEPDGENYFHYHHSSYDKYEMVNYYQLQTGAAAIATLVYLIDQLGTGQNN